MNIGFDAKRLFCNYTGLGNYSRTLVKNLSEYFPGNNYHLFTPQIEITEEARQFFDNTRYSTHLPKLVIKPLWRSHTIKNDLKKQNIQIYHGLSNEIPFNINKTKIKTVVTIHDLIFKHYPDTYSFFDRLIYDYKFKYACKTADKIIAISNNTKADIIKFYNIREEKIEVIYQACNQVYYKQKTDSDDSNVLRKYQLPDDYILYVGSVEKRKNLKTLLKAYKNLDEKINTPLVIIGRGGKYMHECRQLLKNERVKNKIYWLDNLEDNSDLHSIYRKSLMLVYPSLYEGFGLPVVEALLSKTPVITSNVSSLPEAGGPDTIYINPLKDDELANAILEVLNNPELRNKMINSGYNYAVQNFDREKVTNQVVDCYNKLLTQ